MSTSLEPQDLRGPAVLRIVLVFLIRVRSWDYRLIMHRDFQGVNLIRDFAGFRAFAWAKMQSLFLDEGGDAGGVRLRSRSNELHVLLDRLEFMSIKPANPEQDTAFDVKSVHVVGGPQAVVESWAGGVCFVLSRSCSRIASRCRCSGLPSLESIGDEHFASIRSSTAAYAGSNGPTGSGRELRVFTECTLIDSFSHSCVIKLVILCY